MTRPINHQTRLFGAMLLTAMALAYFGARLVEVSRNSPAPSVHGPPDLTSMRLSATARRNELVEVVDAQLAAFRGNNYPHAFTFASATLRQVHTVQSFRNMVRTGYPAIARSQSSNFGLVLDNGEAAVVNVELSSDTDASVTFQYFLVREPGGWKISGVQKVSRRGAQA